MKSSLRLMVILACLSGQVGIAADSSATDVGGPPPSTAGNSALDGRTFYQLVLAEISVHQSDPGTGYSLLLDAARRSNAPELYRRAVEIAIRARAGDAALQATRAWQRAHPTSIEAAQHELEILIALNRVPESAQVLERVLDLSAPKEKLQTLERIPGLYARATDRKAVAVAVEAGLRRSRSDPTLVAGAWAVISRARWLATDEAGALAALQLSQAANPQYEPAVRMALDMLGPERPLAEKLVKRYLQRQHASDFNVRLAYSQALIAQDRPDEALEQLQTALESSPDRKDILLAQGGILIQLHRFAEARQALESFLSSLSEPVTDNRLRQQREHALTALSQIAERQGNLIEAEQWLRRIDPDNVSLTIQARRAGVLARSGQIDAARSVIRAVPASNPGDEKSRFIAEAQLLRELKRYPAAMSVLELAAAAAPADTDLLYEQSLVAEKLGDFTRMESLLRRIVEIQPSSPHAYNALGYSLADRNVRLEEARGLIAKAVELAPEDAYIQDSLGWVEFRLGNHEVARQILERAFQAKPDAEIAAHLGEVLWTLGDRERAKVTWRKGLALNADNDTLLSTLRRFGNPIARQPH